MVKSAQLTPRSKSVCLALSREGLSAQEIGKRVGYHHCSVVRFLKRYRETGSASRRKGSGRKPLSTPLEDRYLKRLCLRDRAATSVELKRAWEAETGVRASSVTVRRWLFRAGLPAHRPRKKSLLTTKMRASRLAWARTHVH
jgi:transposase